MILFTRVGPRPAGSPAAVLLFGSGRLGAAIRESLERGASWKTEAIPFPWGDARGLEAAADAAIRRAVGISGPRGRAAVVWAAGACGFAATEEEASGEALAFGTVLAVAMGIAAATDPGSVDFHLLSSAGGLFEGQLGVGTSSHPAPLRPYGRLKLAEERCALDAAATLRLRVYRASSVYGPVRDGRRMGLVSTLVRDCAMGWETPIFGDMDTLRDYVHADDAGSFVARAVAVPGAVPAPSVSFLASGKATSIRDVLALVARASGRECRVRPRPGGDNDRPITFSPSVLPPGWKPRDLGAGILHVHRDFLAAKKGRGAKVPVAGRKAEPKAKRKAKRKK